MSKIKKTIIILLFSFLLVGCGPSDTAIQTAVSQAISKIPTQTPYPTYTTESSQTPYPTYTPAPSQTPVPTHTPNPTQTPHVIVVTATGTPGPSPTPTETKTPTSSPTFTPTVTPFKISGCIDLKSPPNYWKIEDDKLAAFYDKYDGKCVRFFIKDGFGIVTADYAFTRKLNPTFQIDDDSPPDSISMLDYYSTVWGLWEPISPGESPGKYNFYLRRIEPFPDLQQPIESDGFYMVGDDYDISVGQWKSLWPPGVKDDCYWARTNPDTGGIYSNHFGQAGNYTRVKDGELFETTRCAPWVFIKP